MLTLLLIFKDRSQCCELLKVRASHKWYEERRWWTQKRRPTANIRKHSGGAWAFREGTTPIFHTKRPGFLPVPKTELEIITYTTVGIQCTNLYPCFWQQYCSCRCADYTTFCSMPPWFLNQLYLLPVRWTKIGIVRNGWEVQKLDMKQQKTNTMLSKQVAKA